MTRLFTYSISSLVFAAFTSVSALAQSRAAAAPTKPSAEERVRKAIDNICGDTWCEGDFQFKFHSVTFNTELVQTQVNFTMSPYTSEEIVAASDLSTATIIRPSYEVQCVIKGYADAQQILNGNGSLVDPFYSTMSACVGTLEDSLVKRQP